MRRRFLALALLPLLAFTAVAACSSSDDEASAKVPLADGCSINSDCTEPLVCAFRKCHTACEATRDCPNGERCMASDRPFHVCQLPEEKLCSYNSQCPVGQVCGIDGQCRDQCAVDRDCVPGQLCVTGTCAEPTEVDGGKLPIASDASPEVSGQPCSYDSECADPFVCRSGLCSFECLDDRDCGEGLACRGHLCELQVCGGLDAGVMGGQACGFTSECAPPLVCRDGHCDCECIAAADCASGETCSGFRCVPAGVADGGVGD